MQNQPAKAVTDQPAAGAPRTETRTALRTVARAAVPAPADSPVARVTQRYCPQHDVRACGVLRHRNTRAWLIVRGPHAGGRWHLPGGRLTHGEEPSRTVVREFREELDVVVAATPRVRSVSWTQPSNPTTLGKITIVFDLGFLPAGAQITPAADEIAEWAWVQPHELGDRLHPFDAERAAAIIAEDECSQFGYLEQRRTPGRASAANRDARIGALRAR